MAIKSVKEKESRKPEIDLTGPNGNVFFLMGTAKKWAKDLGKDPDAIIAEMKSGDYENAVQVFEREFGDFVILYQ